LDIKKLYVIQDDKKKLWRDTASIDESTCIRRFVKEWLSVCHSLDIYDAKQVWRIFTKNGWEILELNIEATEEA